MVNKLIVATVTTPVTMVTMVPVIILYADLHVKGKAIPLQALTGPEGSRRLRLPDFKTTGT
jgi:hypothetical protein